MKVNTDEYEWVWNRKPRGTGLWFFELNCKDVKKQVQYSGSYTEASKRAIKDAKIFGAPEVRVLG